MSLTKNLNLDFEFLSILPITWYLISEVSEFLKCPRKCPQILNELLQRTCREINGGSSILKPEYHHHELQDI